MALGEDEKAALMEILKIQELSELEWRLDNLTNAQETRVKADIAAFELIKDDTVGISGGKYGVQIQPEESRSLIRERLRLHLKISAQNSAASEITYLFRS
jgi:hypothetical protein